ncbi:MAG: GIY-YIG nuclease family protein [Candidatus Brocadiia bacterium]
MPVGGFARNVNRSIVDKIAAYVAARGADGVEAQELAGVFLAPMSAPPLLCARLIGNVLSGDPRLVLGPDGRWRANRSGPAAAAGSDYTVIEATEVAAGARHYFIAWAALRVDAAGRAGQTISSAIRPDDPWPPDLVLPPQIRKAVLTGPPLPAAVQQAADFARGSVVVAYRIGGFQSAVARAIAEPGETPQPLSLERLGKRAPGLKTDSREALAARLGLPAREVAGAAATARATAEMLAAMLARKESFGLGEPEGWTELQHPKKIEADFSGFEFDRGFIAGLPESPGIYIMRDANGTALYVGKASNLRARVQRYFRPRIGRDEKTERILEALSRVEIEETGSELAALLAEQRAIRALQPAINIQFDVHDRPEASKGPARRVLLMLSAPDAAEVEIFLLDGNRAMRRVKLPREEALARVRPLLMEFFFGPKKPAGQPEAESEREELQIARSWLDRNADRVNALDVDLAGGLEGTLALLARYLHEPPDSGKVFHV